MCDTAFLWTVLSRGPKALSIDTFSGAGGTLNSLEGRDGATEKDDVTMVPL